MQSSTKKQTENMLSVFVFSLYYYDYFISINLLLFFYFFHYISINIFLLYYISIIFHSYYTLFLLYYIVLYFYYIFMPFAFLSSNCFSHQPAILGFLLAAYQILSCKFPRNLPPLAFARSDMYFPTVPP